MTKADAKRARLLVIGGFLGAGKTTVLLRLARGYQRRGLRVGLITNDQAPQLVDTEAARAGGFPVEEVAGACFCCKFDELTRAAERLRAEERPDVLIGEPVGSCTDLAATVVRPLRRLYGDRYSVAPYSVLVDPARARQIILEKGFGGFSSRVAYIFQKQLEEADIIALNKVDLLDESARSELLGALSREFPRARVIPTSGLTGEGLERWESLLEEGGAPGENVAEVDYDLYAEGEAELGWLNLTLRIDALRPLDGPFDGDALVQDLLEDMRGILAARQAEVAHLKAFLHTPSGAALGSCVGTRTPVRLGRRMGARAGGGRLVLNARVHVDPAVLRQTAEEAIARASSAHGASARVEECTHFRPGRPVPTHRDSPPAL